MMATDGESPVSQAVSTTSSRDTLVLGLAGSAPDWVVCPLSEWRARLSVLEECAEELGCSELTGRCRHLAQMLRLQRRRSRLLVVLIFVLLAGAGAYFLVVQYGWL